MRTRTILSLVLGQLLVLSQVAFGHPVANHPTASPQSLSPNALNFNLASTKAMIVATALELANAVSITVGSRLLTVYPTSTLTPAELIAAYEVETTGSQSLKLGSSGNAIGGRFFIPVSLSQSLSSLVIPQGVKMLANASLEPTLAISGNLIDDGKLVAFAGASQNNTFTLDAENIFLGQSGVITSVVSAPGAAPVNLTLNAKQSIINSGEITSSSSLSLSAGNILNNSGPSSLLQANKDVQLATASGNFSNSGVISSVTGNINIAGGGTNGITFNNAGGCLLAPQGAINFGSAATTSNITLTGGNYLSPALNLFAGTGDVNVQAEQVSGIVNVYAGSAHLSANTANLQIGTFDVSGDPFVSNSGNLDLGGTISGPLSYLVAAAGGSIYCSATGEGIDTSAAGGNVVLAAGVTAVDNAGSISLSRSGTGGDIVLAAGQTIDNNPTQDITAFTTGGGNVTLIAMTDGTAASTNGGHILLPQAVTINTTDAGGNAGSVTILAEASSGTKNAVSLGGVSAGGTGGSVTIRSATANLTGATIDDSTGIITGSFDSTTLQSGTLAPGTVVVGGALTLATTGTINLSGTNTAPSAALTATSLYLPNGTSLATTAGALSITGAVDNLTITGDNNGTASLSAVGGSLSFQSIGNGNLLFTFKGASNVLDDEETEFPYAYFTLDSNISITATSATQIIIDNRVSLSNSTSSGAWSLTAPTINIGFWSDISTSAGNALIAFHTNALSVGDGGHNPMYTEISGSTVTIDDNLPGSVGGLTINITEQDANIQATAGAITISANATTNADITFNGGGIVNLFLAAAGGVQMQATGTVTIGPSIPIVDSIPNTGMTVTATSINIENNASIGIAGYPTGDQEQEFGKPITFNINGGTVTNNGTVSAYGITIASASTLTLLGGYTEYGTYDAGQSSVLIEAATSLSLGNGTNVGTVGNLSIQTPIIIIGAGADSLFATATITTTATAGLIENTKLTIQPSATGSGTLQFSLLNGVKYGELWLQDDSASIISTTTSMPASFTLAVLSGDVTFQTSGNLTLSTILNYSGSINAINESTTTGNISVLPNSSIITASGSITINNNNTANGNISLGYEDDVSASLGSVQIIMGSPTTIVGKASKNIVAYDLGKTYLFFGSHGITGLAPNNYVEAGAKEVNLNTGNLPASAITLGGSVEVSANDFGLITNLDLVDDSAAIISAEQQGYVNGNLKSNGNLKGTVNLYSANLMPILLGDNIPAGVTVNIYADAPLEIETGRTSGFDDQNVVINGTENFVGTTALLVAGASPGFGGFTLGTTGVVKASQSLALVVVGNMVLDGVISAKNTLALATEPDSSGNASITIGGTIGAATSTVALETFGSGNIIQGTTAGSILGATVEMQTYLGSIGTTATAINTQAKTLELSSDQSGDGTANVNDSVAVTLTDTNLAGSLSVNDSKGLTVGNVESNSGTIALTTAGTLTLKTNAQVTEDDGSIYLNSSNAKSGTIAIGVDSNISATASAGGTGKITVSIGSMNPAQVNTKNPSYATVNLSNGGIVYYGTDSITSLKPTNTINANGTTVTFGGGTKSTAITLDGGATITATQAASFEESQGVPIELIVDTGDEE